MVYTLCHCRDHLKYEDTIVLSNSISITLVNTLRGTLLLTPCYIITLGANLIQ